MTSTTSLLAAPSSALDIPETPDLERMRRETGRGSDRRWPIAAWTP